MSINRNNGAPPRPLGKKEPTIERDELSAEDATVSTNRIRQGVTGHNVRYVLLLSTAAVVLAFILVYVAVFR
jgi:hypothetical protein